jgi:hypothetical protein
LGTLRPLCRASAAQPHVTNILAGNRALYSIVVAQCAFDFRPQPFNRSVNLLATFVWPCSLGCTLLTRRVSFNESRALRRGSDILVIHLSQKSRSQCLMDMEKAEYQNSRHPTQPIRSCLPNECPCHRAIAYSISVPVSVAASKTRGHAKPHLRSTASAYAPS